MIHADRIKLYGKRVRMLNYFRCWMRKYNVFGLPWLEYQDKWYNTYVAVVKEINLEVMTTHLVNKAHDVNLPIGKLFVLGTKRQLMIEGKMNPFLRKNMKATFEMWKEYPELRNKQYVYYTNEHTNGTAYQIKFAPNDWFKNMRAMTFKMDAHVKKHFVSYMIDPNTAKNFLTKEKTYSKSSLRYVRRRKKRCNV